jgi:hypothetical protein
LAEWNDTPLVLVIIASIFGLIGYLIGRPKRHAVYGFSAGSC